MKNILPVLTVSALAASASAQLVPAGAPAAKQSLSYNRVVASWVSQSGPGDTGVSLFAQAKIAGGLYVSATATDLSRAYDSEAALLGYAYSLPSVLGINTDLNLEVGYKSLGAGLRFLIGGGLELDVAYAHRASVLDDSFTLGASYNLGFIVKGLSVNASFENGTGFSPNTTSIGIGYNF